MIVRGVRPLHGQHPFFICQVLPLGSLFRFGTPQNRDLALHSPELRHEARSGRKVGDELELVAGRKSSVSRFGRVSMTARMIRKITTWMLLVSTAFVPMASANGYRGYAPAPGGQVVYRPVVAYPGGGYAYGQPVVAVPAYGRPVYYAAPVQAYRPVVAAQPAYNYQQVSQSNYGAAPVTYTSPQPIAAYRPQTNGYAISTSGFGTSGAEASHLYGQATPINYTPPQFYYRSTYAQVPVYTYRPVTVYQNPTGQGTSCMQPTTCLQPTTSYQCQQQRCRLFPWLSNLFCPKPSCNTAPTSCGYRGNCTTSYCAPQTYACAPAGCGQQPYYPAPTTVIPTQPGAVIPAQPSYPAPIPSTPRGPIYGSPTVPPPPTRTPSTFAPAPSTFVPADNAPSLNSGGLRGTSPAPSGAVPAPPSSFNPGGTFPAPGTGTNYPPVADPYLQPSSEGTPVESSSSSGTRYPSSFGSSSPRSQATIRSQSSSGPSLAPAHGNSPKTEARPSLRLVPDPDAPAKPATGAPQLLDPRDQTALRDPRWQVVPAVYGRPSEHRAASMQRKMSYEIPAHASEVSLSAPTHAVAAPVVQNEEIWDDSGWKSARQ